MVRIAHLILSGSDYCVVFNDNNTVAKEMIKHLPISSEVHNIGGEIYFRVPGTDIQYDGTEREEFEIGDIVYGFLPDAGGTPVISLFYGNTKCSNWISPRALIPCVKIGKLINEPDSLQSVKSGENVKLLFK